MAYNSLLYSNKSSPARGTTLWIRGGSLLRVVSTDDFFILVDQAQDLEYSPPVIKAVTLEDLKALEKLLRDETGEFELSDLPFSETHKDVHDYLTQADELAFDDYEAGYEQYGGPWAVSPDRLRKLSLIKPGSYPIDMTRAYERVMLFRCGPTVRGAMSLLDRNVLKGTYKGEELW